jgi:hypothetical protein
MLIADGEGGHVYADGKDRRGDVYLRAPSMDHGQVRYLYVPTVLRRVDSDWRLIQ